jgi:hypothetical protein
MRTRADYTWCARKPPLERMSHSLRRYAWQSGIRGTAPVHCTAAPHGGRCKCECPARPAAWPCPPPWHTPTGLPRMDHAPCPGGRNAPPRCLAGAPPPHARRQRRSATASAEEQAAPQPAAVTLDGLPDSRDPKYTRTADDGDMKPTQSVSRGITFPTCLVPATNLFYKSALRNPTKHSQMVHDMQD